MLNKIKWAVLLCDYVSFPQTKPFSLSLPTLSKQYTATMKNLIRFAAIALAVTTAHAAFADERPLVQGITVTGDCLTKVAQDRGAVTVTSSVVQADARKATEEAISRHERVKSDVSALNLKDFSKQTLSMNVNEECEYNNNRRICTGYRASISTRFETSDIARLGDIIAAASKSGTQEISGLTTFVSPRSMQTAREACLETATRNAASKALKLASGAGVSLGKLINLSEQGTSLPEPPQPAFRGRAMAEGVSAMSAPSIDTQAEDLQVSVVALYAFN